MGDKTGISWCDSTWNPVVGCSVIAPGCTNCYAMGTANARLDGNPKSPHYAGLTEKVNGRAVWTGKVVLAPDHILTAPLRWKRPRRIFVNSMGDLFHEAVPNGWIDRVFEIMAWARHHTFIVLTKRAPRMRGYVECVRDAGVTLPDWPGAKIHGVLPNVILGVSVSDQQTADAMIPDLRWTPAARRAVSYEPALGPVNFTRLNDVGTVASDCLRGVRRVGRSGRKAAHDEVLAPIDWLIIGGESGPRARPCNLEHVYAARDQARKAGVAVFIKQLGARPCHTEGDGAAESRWRAFGGGGQFDDEGRLHLRHRSGADPSEWPDDLRVQEFPETARATAGEGQT